MFFIFTYNNNPWRMKLCDNRYYKICDANLVVGCFYVFLYCVFLAINASCVGKIKQTKFNADEIMIILDKKITNGTVGYDDIFETKYGIYDEHNADTAEALDKLLEKLKNNVKKDKNITNKVIDVDDILQKNLDKIVDRIVDEKYFKYGIYGADKNLWFAKDRKQRAPFNFFQQQFLLLASTDTLKKLTLLSISRMTNGERVYVANYGSFWVLYGNNNHLEEGFELLKQIVDRIEKKYFVQKKQLSKSDLNVLKTVIGMKKFNDIKTNGFSEYVSKTVLISKSSDIVKRCEAILINNGIRI